jgi:iturin family lipopeptide synthetase A
MAYPETNGPLDFSDWLARRDNAKASGWMAVGQLEKSKNGQTSTFSYLVNTARLEERLLARGRGMPRWPNLRIRAGSVVLPLRDPLSVVEEWSMVDNLSNGRAGVSFASGWRPDDFVLAPSNFERRRQITFEGIDAIRRAWRGETLRRAAPKGQMETRTYPRPIQKELPVWLTCAGNPDTWTAASKLGASVLTAVLAQNIGDLARNIANYRAAEDGGNSGARNNVSLVLHTYVGSPDENVADTVRVALSRYLETHVSIHDAVKGLADGKIDCAHMTEADKKAIVGFACERYLKYGSLIGNEEQCTDRLRYLQAIGVDEVACQIDFGLPRKVALDGLRRLLDLSKNYTTAKKGFTADRFPAHTQHG